MASDVCFQLIISVQREQHGQASCRGLIEHLIHAREKHGVEREGAGLGGVSAEPHWNAHVVEAARGDQLQIAVLDPASPSTLVRLGLQAIAEVDATPEVHERSRRLPGHERFDPLVPDARAVCVRALKPLHRLGSGTTEIIVEGRACVALARHGIVVAGVSDAASPYHMSRLPAWHTEVLACFQGSGRQWVDSQWVRQTAGMVCVAPDGAIQAFHAIRGQRWGFAWIQYHPGKLPLRSREVTLIEADAEPLRAGIALLHREFNAKADPAILAHVGDLLQMLVLRILGRHELDQRITRVLERVTSDLCHRWTSSELAQTARVSNEQLRRLFQRHLGRSPLHRVLELRLARASELLRTTNLKVEAIAHEVGYSSVYAFSSAFSRELGCSPSAFRQRSRTG